MGCLDFKQDFQQLPPLGREVQGVRAAIGLGALACAAQGWALRRTTATERVLLVLAGLFLVFPSLLEAVAEAIIGRDISYTPVIGAVLFVIVLLKQRLQPDAPPVEASGGQ